MRSIESPGESNGTKHARTITSGICLRPGEVIPAVSSAFCWIGKGNRGKRRDFLEEYPASISVEFFAPSLRHSECHKQSFSAVKSVSASERVFRVDLGCCLRCGALRGILTDRRSLWSDKLANRKC